MNKKILFLIIIIIILLFNVSCEKRSNDTFSDGSIKTYEKTIINLPDNKIIKPNSTIYKNERIYCLCFEEKDNMILYYLFSCDINGNNQNIISLDSSIKNPEMTVSSDGIFYIIGSPESNRNVLYKLSPEGEVLSKINLTGLFNNTDGYTFAMNKIYLYNNKIYIVSNNNNEYYIYSLTLDGKEPIIISADDYISDLTELSDGRIIIKCGAVNWRYYFLDDLSKLDFNIPNSDNKSYSLLSGEGYDIFVHNSNGIYGYNYNDDKDGKTDLLLNWINYDIYQNNIRNIYIDSSDIIICEFINSLDAAARDVNDYKILVLSASEKTVKIDEIMNMTDYTVTEKQDINLAIPYFIEEHLKKIILSFNQTNERYRINIIDYSSQAINIEKEYREDYSLDLLNKDLIKGNIPDIVIQYNYRNHNNYGYEKKGLYADLYELLVDKTLNNILTPIKTSLETDGKLYTIPVHYTLTTLIGKTSMLGNKNHITIDEFVELNNNLGDGKRLLLRYDAIDFFNTFLYSGLVDFINYDNYTCNFIDERFIELINLIKHIPETYHDDIIVHESQARLRSDFIQDIRNDNAYFYETDITTIEEFLYYQYFYDNADYNIIGYPNENNNGTIFNSIINIGVTQESKVKEGAKEFLEYLLSDEIQIKYTDERFLPLTLSAWEYNLNDLKDYYFYPEEIPLQISVMGGQWESLHNYYKLYSVPLSDDIETENDQNEKYYIADEYIDFILNFINDTNIYSKYNYTVFSIIRDEIDEYLNDKITAEQCANYIQNRLSIYLSEQS